ncbi:right-handed parallel beta-helix repeat-containing protein [Geminicoccus flavidas]|uniref:right-handed parallel beta-helix repeat-containing protein n=1 Tax=Geminicoccus flavidas TaxID=2506407 RepID=UPI0013591715|nr:right-handed parallel beta-helix repeat-containing protein [Geminicoccus flavidas]
MRRRSILPLLVGVAALPKAAMASPHDKIVSVKDFGAVGDGETDDSAAFLSALASGARTIVVPATEQCYRLQQTIRLNRDATLVGEGEQSCLRFVGDFGPCIEAAADCTLHGLRLDGDGEGKKRPSPGVRVTAPGVRIIACIVENARSFNIEVRSRSCVISGGIQRSSLGTGIGLLGPEATDALIEAVEFQRNRYFGVWVTQGAHRNTVRHCRTEGNGLELVGITFDSYGNTIEWNEVSGSGDNGISVTGHSNLLSFNRCMSNRFHGIGVYGSFNTIIGNQCFSNGLNSLNDTNVFYGGISLISSFGGVSRLNILDGNESGPSDSQACSIKYWPHDYHDWSAEQLILGRDPFRIVGGDLCRAANAAPGFRMQSGSRRPSFEDSSLASDGRLEWRRLASGTSLDGVEVPAWQPGLALDANRFCQVDGFVYLSRNSGITGRNSPSHRAGSRSDGGIDWELVGKVGGSLNPWGNLVRPPSGSNADLLILGPQGPLDVFELR